MEMKILNEKGDELVFSLNADMGFANALRRIMMNEIPVLAVDTIDFEENSSPLFDEILAHRLALVPLEFDPKLFSLREKCKCGGKGCSRCTVSLSLEKQGPCVVRSGDLKSKVLKVKDKNIPIVELLEEQSIKLTAKVTLGLGKDHVKWQSAVVGYHNLPAVRLDPNKNAGPCMDVCPKGVFSRKAGRVSVVSSSSCNLCMRCTEVSDAVHVSADNNKFIFTVETTSGLSAKQILSQALDILKQRSQELIKETRKLKI